MYYVGIDISNQTFHATKIETPENVLFYGKEFDNTEAGFKALRILLDREEDSIVLESTGVYGEQLCLYFYQARFHVFAEPPQYVRRAFRLKRKTDKVDSRMIAEYGFRYADQLHPWKPRSPIYEEVLAILNNQELLVKQRTATKKRDQGSEA